MILVDAANVVGSRPDGWWRDRPRAARNLVEAIRAAVGQGRLSGPVLVVLEGAARGGTEEGALEGVSVVHAPRSGDDTLVALAEEVPAGEPLIVVSADRQLRRRLAAGAETVGPRWLLDRLG